MSERSRYERNPRAKQPRSWPEERSDRHDLELKQLLFFAPGEQLRVRLRITSFSDESAVEYLFWLTDVETKHVVLTPRVIVPGRCAFSADGALLYLQSTADEPLEVVTAADGRPCLDFVLPRRREEVVFFADLLMRAGHGYCRMEDDFLARLLADRPTREPVAKSATPTSLPSSQPSPLPSPLPPVSPRQRPGEVPAWARGLPIFNDRPHDPPVEIPAVPPRPRPAMRPAPAPPPPVVERPAAHDAVGALLWRGPLHAWGRAACEVMLLDTQGNLEAIPFDGRPRRSLRLDLPPSKPSGFEHPLATIARHVHTLIVEPGAIHAYARSGARLWAFVPPYWPRVSGDHVYGIGPIARSRQPTLFCAALSDQKPRRSRPIEGHEALFAAATCIDLLPRGERMLLRVGSLEGPRIFLFDPVRVELGFELSGHRWATPSSCGRYIADATACGLQITDLTRPERPCLVYRKDDGCFGRLAGACCEGDAGWVGAIDTRSGDGLLWRLQRATQAGHQPTLVDPPLRLDASSYCLRQLFIDAEGRGVAALTTDDCLLGWHLPLLSRT